MKQLLVAGIVIIVFAGNGQFVDPVSPSTFCSPTIVTVSSGSNDARSEKMLAGGQVGCDVQSLGRLRVDSWRVCYIALGEALGAEAARRNCRSKHTVEPRSIATAVGLSAELVMP